MIPKNNKPDTKQDDDSSKSTKNADENDSESSKANKGKESKSELMKNATQDKRERISSRSRRGEHAKKKDDRGSKND